VIAIASMGRKEPYKFEAKGLKNGSINISKLNQMFENLKVVQSMCNVHIEGKKTRCGG
jgi:hypothetical protein